MNNSISQSSIDDVIEWLLDASSQIGKEYFQLPVYGCEEPEYRERVYCYELYHRWRCRWPDAFPYSLSGEVDKARHPLIRKSLKPDFLVHVPGSRDNLFVMEVKSGNAPTSSLRDDLKKLMWFLDEPAKYQAASLWIYGLEPDVWPDLKGRIIGADLAEEYLHSISIFVHSEAGKRAVRVGW